MNEIERRKEWARRLIGNAAGLTIPEYGSARFLALPEGSPVKVASVVRAAEAWARAGDDLADDIAYELEHHRRAQKAHEDAAYVAGIEEHRQRWRHLRVVDQPAEPPRDLYEIGAEYMAEHRRRQQGGDRR